ncbi:MAG: conjugal transfer protein TrbI [Planctomycetaceae bacterium]|nr:conjugal transfer protein TrbI [Planctomycetaceae bacterium]
MSEQDKLSPDASPKIMEVKTKRARRINNWPVFIAFVVFGVISLTLGLVVVSRSNRAKAEIGQTIVKKSDAFAKELTSQAEAGMVNPPPPVAPPPQAEPPADASKEPEQAREPSPPEIPSIPDAKAQTQPRMTDEARKMREKHWRQVEAAIDGPIKAQIDEVKATPRAISAEIAEVERQLAALGSSEGQTYAERLAAIRASLDTGGEADYSRRGDLSRMNQFSGATNWTNPARVESPSTMHIIRTGSVIPATLVSGINSDLPGQIVGQVAQDVYDTPTGNHLLIPQGSRLVGEYSSDVQYGQSRVFAVWQRIVFPDGKALDLGAMPGSSGAGYSGFNDRVNNHYVRIFGSAIMMSGILAGVSMTQNNQDYDDGSNRQRMSDAMSEALGQQLGGVMAEMLQKNMNIAPTLEIRPGYRFNVMLVKDLFFSGPYAGFDYARQQ